MFNKFKKITTPPTDPDLEWVISTTRNNVNFHSDIPFSSEERAFFQALIEQCRANNLNPRDIHLTRMSSMGFNVDTYDGYIGKINLYTGPEKYAVIKKGGKRAAKVFGSKDEAEDFLSTHEDYIIEIRQGEDRRHMQYLIGLHTVKELDHPTLDECIAAIPYWIRHMKYCKRC